MSHYIKTLSITIQNVTLSIMIAFSITLKVDTLSIVIKNVTLSRIANIITTLSITLKCEVSIMSDNIPNST
jgi:hypothetical protein